MTLYEARQLADRHDVAVYRSDKINAIIERVNAAVRQRREAEAARLLACAASQRRVAVFATSQTYGQPRVRQYALRFGPRDWSGVCGKVLTRDAARA